MKIMHHLRKLFRFPHTRLSPTEKRAYNHAENDFTSEGGPLPEQEAKTVEPDNVSDPAVPHARGKET